MEVSKIASVLDDRDNDGLFTAIIFTDEIGMKTLAKTLEDAAPDEGLTFEGWSKVAAWTPGITPGNGMAYYAFDFGCDERCTDDGSGITVEDVVILIQKYF